MAQGKNPCVSIEVMVMGPIENNVYILSDGEATLVVDPTEYASFIVDALDGRKLDAIVLTHAHWDHVGGACDLRRLTGAQTIASAVDAPYITGEKTLDSSHRQFTPCPVDKMVVDGEELVIGNMKWKVLETPGHTRGSICLFLDPQYGSDPDGAPVLISGDTLFHGAHGRTDFEGGNPADMIASLARLADLPGDTVVLPGHNDITTIAGESWLSRTK